MNGSERLQDLLAQRVASELQDLRVAVAHARGRLGRDFIRALPLGKTLDHLDVGRDCGAEMERVQAELGALKRKFQRVCTHQEVEYLDSQRPGLRRCVDCDDECVMTEWPIRPTKCLHPEADENGFCILCETKL